MAPLVRYSLRFVCLLLMQYVLSEMFPLGGYITPYIYFIFVLWLPFNISNTALLVLSAFYGLTYSYLVGTPGLHGATCVLIAFLRIYLLQLLLVKDAKDQNFAEPSIHSMGMGPYTTYVIILVLAHHTYLIFLQWLSAGDFLYFLKKLILTSAVSLILVTILEMILPRKLKVRASLR